MTRIAHFPTWFKLTAVALVVMVTLRYMAALDSGVSPGVAMRTYVFWALVCGPGAWLAEMVLQSVMNHGGVQSVATRIKAPRDR